MSNNKILSIASIMMAGMEYDESMKIPYTLTQPDYTPYHLHGSIPNFVSNGKSRKKKTNKIHRSRMLRRKHAKK